MSSFKCKIREHAPLVFKHLRHLDKITDSDLCDSFDIIQNLPLIRKNSGNKGGRSSAFFYFSHDRKFLVKTITRNEKTVLLDILLPPYHSHIAKNSHSFISRIFGLFTLSFNNTKLILIIMQNIFAGAGDIQAAFDLKGSRVSRQAISHADILSLDDVKNDRVYKDLDFLHFKKGIVVEHEDAMDIQNIIYKDTQLFKNLNIMDYSLLLGILTSAHPNSYKGTKSDSKKFFMIGIIDYLQTFSTVKRLESIGKSLVNPGVPKTDISAIGSEEYSDRFLKFIKNIINSESSFEDM